MDAQLQPGRVGGGQPLAHALERDHLVGQQAARRRRVGSTARRSTRWSSRATRRRTPSPRPA
ncbi:MAG: hypothetical protein M0C28_16205 [Candidatus Moduliflexus flocculans]|nr:hypothetical protein [Candidatus Moduliflexus flocculans]